MPLPLIPVVIGLANGVRAFSLLRGVAHAAHKTTSLLVTPGVEGIAGVRTLELTMHGVSHSMKVTRAGEVTLAALNGSAPTSTAINLAKTALQYGRTFAPLYPEAAATSTAAPTMMRAGNVVHQGIGMAARVVR